MTNHTHSHVRTTATAGRPRSWPWVATYIPHPGKDLQSFVTGPPQWERKNSGISRQIERLASEGGERGFVYKKIVVGEESLSRRA